MEPYNRSSGHHAAEPSSGTPFHGTPASGGDVASGQNPSGAFADMRAKEMRENRQPILIGHAIPVHRIGFGTLRLTGPGGWGWPSEGSDYLTVLRSLADEQINFVDTADAYGPDVAEPMLREALYPYPEGFVIATKGGQVRTGPNQWTPLGRPEYLLQQVKMSLRRLHLDQLPLWFLHRIDPKVPRDEQFDCVRTMIRDGLIRFAGLSEVQVEDIARAREFFPVAAVQNKYNLVFRKYEPVLEYCERNEIVFIPWSPLSAGDLSRTASLVGRIAEAHGASMTQVALAWLLQRSPLTLPIPGTSTLRHLKENAGSYDLVLSQLEMGELEGAHLREGFPG